MRPLSRRELDDAAILRLTRWIVCVAAGMSVLAALFFRSMVSAWIAMATVLVAAALVPTLAALYLPARPRRQAGLWSSVAGLVAAIAVFVAVTFLGAPSEEWGTTIWTVRIGGLSPVVWQEYTLLFALPASLAGFAAGQPYGRGEEGTR